MAWVVVNAFGEEYIHNFKPLRGNFYWWFTGTEVKLPKGSIKKLIGRDLTWEDDPVELK